MYVSHKDKLSLIIISVSVLLMLNRFDYFKKEDMGAKQKQILLLEQKKNALEELSGVKKGLNRLREKIKADSKDFKSYIYNLGRSNNVCIYSLTPMKCSGYKSVKCLSYSIAVSGSLDSLTSFVKALEKKDGLLFITNFSFSSVNKNNKTGEKSYSAVMYITYYWGT